MSRRSRTIRWIFGTIGAGAVAAIGCATADTPVATISDTEDASAPDSSNDAATSADVDAGVDDNDAAIVVPTRACSADNWCPTPLPKAEVNPKKYDLRAVWVAPSHEAFAASYTGDVLAWDGTAWKEIYESTAQFRQIWGSSPSELWLVTEAQGLVRGKKDAAGVWSFAPEPTPGPVLALWGVGETEIWASASVGLLRWNGESAETRWTAVPTPRSLPGAFGGGRILSFWGSGPNDFWGRGAQWASDCEDCDGPQGPLLVHWDPNGVASPSDAGVEAGASDAGATPPGVWKTVEVDPRAGREMWQLVPAGSAGGETQVLCSVRGCDQVTLHGTPSGDPNHLTYADKTIVGVSPRGVKAIWGSHANDIWAVGLYGSVSHFDGTAWSVSRITPSSTPISRHMYAVHGVVDGDQSDVWVVGANVTLHRTGAQ